MLVSQHNGLGVSGDTEADVLQNLACSIGPRVDGIAAGMAVPQSMGAFSTYGAQTACAGRDQQQEQHQPTTTTHREFGDSFPTVGQMTTSPSVTTALQSKLQAMRDITAVKADMVAPPAASVMQPPPLGPAMPVTMYPAGTITAFDAKTNMWRVAIPATALGLGIFGATASFTEVAPTQAPPAGATQVSPTQFQKQTGTLPIYKQWWFWGAIAGAAIGVGGTVVLLRRKHA